MSEIEELTRSANAALAALARVDRRGLSDHEIASLARANEQSRRLVDASLAQDAAEIDDRSEFALGAEGLSFRNGYRRPIPFIEELTRASQKEIAARIRLGHAMRPPTSLIGEVLPPPNPFVAEGVKSGAISADAAGLIIRSLWQARTGTEASFDNMQAAEQSLAELAAISTTDLVATAARAWRDALDPSGIEPRERDINARRDATAGRVHNGIMDIHLKVNELDGALILTMWNESRADNAPVRFLSDEDRAAGTQVELDENGREIEVLHDPRTPGQRRHDVFMGVLKAGFRASSSAEPDMRTTGQVIVTITAAELEAGVGAGWVTGAEEPISAATVERMICDSGFRLQILGNNNVAFLESGCQRYFTSAQRRAMIVRDGDRCIGPGCTVPVARCDAHHIIFWKNGGPTTLANGGLLCAGCHSALHSGAFELRMFDGVPYLRLDIDRNDPNGWRRAGRARTMGTAA